MTRRFDDLADAVLAGTPATADDALDVLRATDDELLAVVAAAARLRRKHFGNTVKVNYLVNLKSGLCPEDCHYCSQRLGSQADILKYTWLKPDEAIEQAARRARAAAPPGSAWCRAAAVRPTATSTGWPAWSARSRRSTRTSRCAPASGCSRTARPSGCARPASTRTTTTSTPPSRTTTTSSRPTPTRTGSTPSPRPRTPACRRARASSPGWARPTSSSSRHFSPCATSARTRSRSTS